MSKTMLKKDVLSIEDAKALITNLANTRGKKGFTTKEAEKVCAWGRTVIMEYAFFQLAIKQEIKIDYQKDDMVFMKGGE